MLLNNFIPTGLKLIADCASAEKRRIGREAREKRLLLSTPRVRDFDYRLFVLIARLSVFIRANVVSFSLISTAFSP